MLVKPGMSGVWAKNSQLPSRHVTTCESVPGTKLVQFKLPAALGLSAGHLDTWQLSGRPLSFLPEPTFRFV